MSIAGRAWKLSEVRNKASRVAFPATNSAVTVPAHSIASRIERDVGFISVM
jgi:hypothetical protein